MADRLNVRYSVAAKVEATYGAGVALTYPTDLLAVFQEPWPTPKYSNEGDRGGAWGGTGSTPNIAPIGGTFTVPVVQELVGNTTALSASVTPAMHTLARIGGHAALFTASDTLPTVVGGGTAPTWKYSPLNDYGAYESAQVELNARRVKWTGLGAYVGELELAADNPWSPIRVTGNVSAIWSGLAPTDLAAFPSNQVPAGQAIAGLRLANAKWYLNSVLQNGVAAPAIKLIGMNFNTGRQLEERSAEAAGLHSGFSMLGREPRLTLTMEAKAHSVFNPYTARTSASYSGGALELSIPGGGTVGHRFYLRIGYPQLINVEEVLDGRRALWTLTYKAPVSDIDGTDDYFMLWY